MGTNRVATAFLLAFSVVPFAACGDEKKEEPKNNTEPDGAGNGGNGGAPGDACKNPRPFVGVNPEPTGFTFCDGNLMHRSEVRDCASLLPRTNGCRNSTTADGSPLGSCGADSDCTDKPNGFCTSGSSNAFCYCDYGCIRDADCGGGYVCVCATPLGKCVKATCASDAECGAGFLCLTANEASCGQVYACQKPEDQCWNHSDCKPPTSACTLVDGHRECREPTTCR